MPKFNFNFTTPIDSAVAYTKIKNLLNGENDFKKFDPQVSCNFDETNKKCLIKGAQFSAELQVKSEEPKSSLISIEIELPFALSLFKGKIQELLEKNLKKILT